MASMDFYSILYASQSPSWYSAIDVGALADAEH
jgi:hypothetical protein